MENWNILGPSWNFISCMIFGIKWLRTTELHRMPKHVNMFVLNHDLVHFDCHCYNESLLILRTNVEGIVSKVRYIRTWLYTFCDIHVTLLQFFDVICQLTKALLNLPQIWFKQMLSPFIAKNFTRTRTKRERLWKIPHIKIFFAYLINYIAADATPTFYFY